MENMVLLLHFFLVLFLVFESLVKKKNTSSYKRIIRIPLRQEAFV